MLYRKLLAFHSKKLVKMRAGRPFYFKRNWLINQIFDGYNYFGAIYKKRQTYKKKVCLQAEPIS